MNADIEKYEKRIVAYIDILGFKDLIDLTTTKSGRDDKKFIKHILNAYKTFRKVWNEDLSYQKAYRRGSSKLVTYFSDCIVTSFRIKDEIEIYHTVSSIRQMLMRLIRFGIICRGAITIGKVIHRPSLIFGPALVDAYLQEKDEAIYPRVILSKKIAEVAEKYPKMVMDGGVYRVPKQLILKDTDDKYYVDYFSFYADDSEYPDIDTYYYLKNLRQTIVDGLALSEIEEFRKLQPKYKWMQDKFNEALKYHQSKEHLDFFWKIEFTDYKIMRKIKNLKPISDSQQIKEKV